MLCSLHDRKYKLIAVMFKAVHRSCRWGAENTTNVTATFSAMNFIAKHSTVVFLG